jgi:hypothetical protein
MTIVNERGSFLNDEQKSIKQEIMENLINSLYEPLKENNKLFEDPQNILDLITSILVMFNREIIFNTLFTFGITNEGSRFMRKLFDEIRKQVAERVNLAKN